MLNIKDIRLNPEFFIQNLQKRNVDNSTIIKEEISKLDKITEEKSSSINEILMSLPNLPCEDVPVGTDENQNIEIRKIGECKVDDKILPHDEIGEKIRKIDFETAVNRSY